MIKNKNSSVPAGPGPALRALQGKNSGKACAGPRPERRNLMEDNAPDILTLEDEAGQEHVFEVIDAVDFEDRRYLAVVPYIETEEDAEAALAEDADLIIMRVGEEDGEEFLDIVEDDEEFYNVGEVFAKRLSELYDIEGGDGGPVS